MQEEQTPEPQVEVADKPTEPQHEQMPVFEIGSVSIIVTE